MNALKRFARAQGLKEVLFPDDIRLKHLVTRWITCFIADSN